MGIMGVVGNAKENNAAGGLGRYDVKRKNNWVMEFKGLGHTTLQNSLIIQLQASARPNLTIGEQEIRWANERWYIATVPTPEALTVTFYDALPTSGVTYKYSGRSNTSPHPDGNTSMVSAGQILYDWWLLMYDASSGRIGLASVYKISSMVTLYNAWDTPVERWLYIGLFPTNLNYGELNYTSDGEPCLIEATLRYDKVYRIGTDTAIEPSNISDQRGPEDTSQLGMTGLVSG